MSGNCEGTDGITQVPIALNTSPNLVDRDLLFTQNIYNIIISIQLCKSIFTVQSSQFKFQIQSVQIVLVTTAIYLSLLFMFPIVIECNVHWACLDPPLIFRQV